MEQASKSRPGRQEGSVPHSHLSLPTRATGGTDGAASRGLRPLGTSRASPPPRLAH